jgi:hypothetical protein
MSDFFACGLRDYAGNTAAMCARPSLAFAIMTLATVLSPCPSSAQPSKSGDAAYRRVYSSDVIMGYVSPGQLIETSGHIWFRQTGVFLNVNAPSAHVPLLIDVSAVPAEKRTSWAACAAPEQGLGGGCEAVIRGKTGLIAGRRGIFAHAIEIQADR